MSELTIFKNAEFGEIRTITKDDNVWFVGKDVAGVLGYERPTKAVVDNVEPEDREMVDGKTQSQFGIELGQRGGWVINESGLYSLVLSSKLPSAKKFKHWVTSEVLPTIRRNGLYAMDELLENPDLAIQALQKLKEERELRKKLEIENSQMKPKAIFADAVSASDTSILIGELAKILRQNGVELGQNRLFESLRRDGFLISRKGVDWNMPTQRAMEAELFQIKERTIQNPDGSVRITKTTLVTGKGQQYFINRYLRKTKKVC